MNLVRCEKGHFYDGDKLSSCPYCVPGEDDRNVTVARQDSALTGGGSIYPPEKDGDGIEVTIPLREQGAVNLKEVAERNLSSSLSLEDDDDMGKTVRYYDNSIGTEPVVGWLVCLNGENFGQSFVLKSGRNFIGRGRDMDIVLSGDDSVSRNKHAIVVYEPKAKMFIAQPGESRELFYVNDRVVLNNEQIRKNDILSLGKTKLMLIPCCDECFCWEDAENEK